MVVLVVCVLNTLFKRSRCVLDMYTHLAWCWWAADPVRLMSHTRDEMESLRRWRLSDDVWNIVTPRIQTWVIAQLRKHVPEYTPNALQALADTLGKEIHTHILYHIILPVIRPIHVYKRHVPFHETLRRT